MKLVNPIIGCLLACLLLIVWTLGSCKKEVSDSLSTQDEKQANFTATESHVEADGVFNGIFDDALGVNNQVALGGTGLFMRRGDGSSYTLRTDPAPACLNVVIAAAGTTNDPFPITITLDFAGGCPGADGHVRKGKIMIKYLHRLIQPGSSASIEFQDFSIDSLAIGNGTKYTISNTGTDDKLQFTIDINARLNKSNGDYTQWRSHKVITRTDGGATGSPLDDVMQVEGNASGQVKRSDVAVAWKAEITSPFIKRFTCRWISQGTIRIGRESLAPNSDWMGVLDYGTGNCDNHATLTLGGVAYQITLR
jgi:hypothetical protein